MIEGYIHVATIGDWKQILQDQMETIYKSGLHSLCRLNLCKVGPETSDQDWSLEKPHLEEFEYPTLAKLYERSHDLQGVSFYVHLKGVSKTPEHWSVNHKFYHDFAGLKDLESLQRNEWHWRKYMEYFVLEQHSICFKTLENHDVCGVQWRQKPFPHFSGNFWWARNDYLRRLEHPYDFRSKHEDYRDEMGSNRSVAEFWIGSCNPRVGVLYNNALNLYAEPVPPYKYKRLRIY
jgi:hypothetical protein